jgi:hypothetical protein
MEGILMQMIGVHPKKTVFREVIPRNLVEVSRRFGIKCNASILMAEE